MSVTELQQLWAGQTLYWREPLWLLLALQPALLALFRRLLYRQHPGAYADRNLHPWVIITETRTPARLLTRLLTSRSVAWIIAWLLLGISAAGPRLASDIHGENTAAAMDIYLVVDVSRSMQVSDVLPNRLRRTRFEIEEFLQTVKDNHNQRIGIIVYTAKPHVFAALTGDHDVLRFYLTQLDSLVLPGLGSQPRLALQLAQQELQASTNRRAIVWMTDGDFSSSDSRTFSLLQQRIDNLQQDHIALSVMGLGTAEGDAIQLPGGQWLSDNGQAVISRMDEAKLQSLSQQASGSYSAVADDDSDWQTLYYDGIALGLTTGADNLDANRVVWTSLFPWTLVPALFFLFVAVTPYTLCYKNTRRHKNIAHPSGNVLLYFVALVLSLTLPASKTAQAASHDNSPQAFEQFDHRDYQSANQSYARLPGYYGRLGEGASRYRLQDYNAAILQFIQATLDADTDSQRATALYNLGNSYFLTGQYATAAEIFRDSLQYRPDQTAAQHNLDASLRLKQLVEERVRQTPRATNRAGRGPRSARTDRSISTDNSGVTPDLSDDLPVGNANLSGSFDEATTEALIQKGLQHIRLASGDAGKHSQIIWGQQTTTVQLNEISDDRGKLWKRLFEIEEGLDAPADQPATLPGIKPW